MFPAAGCVQIIAALTTRTCERTKQSISTCAAVFKYKTGKQSAENILEKRNNWEVSSAQCDTEICILSISTLQ